MDLNVYRTDAVKETDGVWRTVSGESKVLIAKMGNPKYKTAITKHMKELVPVGIDPREDMPEVEKAVILAMAETILLDWTVIQIDSVDIEPTLENRIRVLEEFPEFREVISSMSMDRNSYIPDTVEKK